MNEAMEAAPLSWDAYWHGARDAPAYAGGGSSHPAVLGFWTGFFEHLHRTRQHPRIIDVASGNGAVVASAREVYGETLPDFTCVDISASAIDMLARRFPAVTGVVADAASMPFNSESFDVATSQFGLEYAGLDALGELARLVAPGGEMVLLVHYSGGLIQSECRAARDAISELQNTEFVPRCRDMFAAAFELRDGGDREAYAEAGRNFAPALEAVEAIMARHGGGVADGTLLRIYRDVRDIHGRLDRYAADDVLGWLDALQGELDAYAGRMASMVDAAVDESALAAAAKALESSGFGSVERETLCDETRDLPIAWVVRAQRRVNPARPGGRAPE